MAGGFGIQSGGVPKHYPGKVTAYILITCIAAAMGGLIFAYDIGISGSVTFMPPFLRRFFPAVYQKEALDKSTNQYCKFDNFTLTMFTSSLYLAALVASLGASKVTRSLGRRWSMLLGGTIFLYGALINAAAQNIVMLIIGRILLSVGVGFTIKSVLLYVSEMAPYKHHGTLNVLFHLSIAVGNLCDALSYVA
ncbi:sugar transport protein 1-like [Syzygium oleosum]|uniref:sugar transport protein 1-like n=1 Tax=Syzygium oleosum TaxID=219896 RepID=UPI0024BB12FF|nr:sugar transport protein 1-like [Syzygium oleosum]